MIVARYEVPGLRYRKDPVPEGRSTQQDWLLPQRESSIHKDEEEDENDFEFRISGLI